MVRSTRVPPKTKYRNWMDDLRLIVWDLGKRPPTKNRTVYLRVVFMACRTQFSLSFPPMEQKGLLNPAAQLKKKEEEG